jgi:predicted RNase H-like nuclease (RuvC/YqgF family)
VGGSGLPERRDAMLGIRVAGAKAGVFAARLALSCCALACCLTAAGPVRAQGTSQPASSGDGVAEAARKARENKKAAPQGKKVYTDDDVRPAAPETAPANAAPGASQPATPDSAGANIAAAPDKSDEKTWRARFQAQRDQIARTEKELDVLQREEEKAQVQYYPDPQKALSEQYSRKDINDKDAKIAAKKQEIAQLKQELDDLEVQLRKAGGDPGWAR